MFKSKKIINNKNWKTIKLICFDVDGTLYNQRKLRYLMLYEIFIEFLKKRNFKFIHILKKYRSIREHASSLSDKFEENIINQISKETKTSKEEIQKIILEWIHKRPLKHLLKCRYTGVKEFFLNLKKDNKRIGIFSDYPAYEKIKALKLNIEVDYIICAGDKNIRLKPNPDGLFKLMDKAQTSPENTLFIGDRFDKDALAGKKAKTNILILSSKKNRNYKTFNNYENLLNTYLLEQRNNAIK